MHHILVKTLLLIAVLVFTVQHAHSQNRENVWAFGFYGGLDFNNGAPVGISTSMWHYEGSASICDNAGQLLFYTDGYDVWDKNHNIMPNGAFITHGYLTKSCTQGALIVPFIDDTTKYYIFSLTDKSGGPVFSSCRLYYSVVDMTLNGGLGDVDVNKKGIIVDSNLSEKMTGIPGDDCNIWVVVHNNIDSLPVFKSYEVTNAGINMNPVLSPIGTYFAYMQGCIIASYDRKTLVACNLNESNFDLWQAGFEVYRFDPQNGTVPAILFSEHDSIDREGYFGAAFSKDDSKLYLDMFDPWGTGHTIFQLDMSIANPLSSKTLIDSFFITSASHLKMGPDGKIYFIPYVNSNKVGAINFPDQPGLACQLVENVVQLPGNSVGRIGLTNTVPFVIPDTATVIEDTTLCFFDSLQLSVPIVAWLVKWENGDQAHIRTVYQPGTYVATYRIGCTFFIHTFNILSADSIVSGAGYICDDSIKGYAWVTVPAASGIFAFTWKDSSGNILRANTAPGTDSINGLSPGAYWVSVQTSMGCDTSIQIIIPEPDLSQLQAYRDTSICSGDSATLYAVGGNSYSWSPAQYISNISDSLVHVYPQATAMYQVLIRKGDCQVTRSLVVNIEQVHADAGPDQSIRRGETAVLHATGGVHYLWSPASSLDPVSSPDPIATPLETTRYYVTVTSALGCTATDSVVVYVAPNAWIPTVFSPNGDGINDFFGLLPANDSEIKLLNLSVYNRWGERVFVSNNIKSGWNGTWKSTPCDIGVYFFTCDYASGSGRYNIKGDVTLVR